MCLSGLWNGGRRCVFSDLLASQVPWVMKWWARVSQFEAVGYRMVGRGVCVRWHHNMAARW